MIEVTEEMRDLVVNWRSKSPSPYFALEHTIQALIELHEANKPTQKPLSDKQLATIITNAYRYDYTHYDLARTIEQAHGIGTPQTIT